MITAAMANVKARVMAVRRRSARRTPSSRVKVHVKVEGDGHVSERDGRDARRSGARGVCVAAVQRATFPKTQTGNSFGIPYSF